MDKIVDPNTAGYLAGELASAGVVVSSLLVNGMPMFATFLAIVWYVICITSSRPVRGFMAKLKRREK